LPSSEAREFVGEVAADSHHLAASD